MNLNRTFAVAPMMDWTDRHCRYFMRLLAPNVLLYTEMVTADAILHGDREKLLGFDAREHPVALQLGGNDPDRLAAAARISVDFGYDEINLNIGCPSDRVQSGRFGACLMAHPNRVARCVTAIREAVDVPVTVKTRIGIDDHDDYEFLLEFIDRVASGGCDTFIIHARKAILEGLSPKDNRRIPPLHYERVERIKNDRPDLIIVLNGGITTLEAVREHLAMFDGVMIGRQAYHDPYFLKTLNAALVPDSANTLLTREQTLLEFMPYVREQLERGVRLQSIVRHIMGLFAGQPGAKRWRRYLSENAHKAGAGVGVLEQSLELVGARSEPVADVG